MAILPQHALKGLNIPARGNAPGKGYIFPKSPERAIYKNKYMSRPFRAPGYGILKSQGVALGWYVSPFQG